MTSKSAPDAIDLEQLLSGAQLPALPQSAITLLELSKDPENGPAEFAVPIESDPGLTGQVLRFVNSSYFGFSREISSVKLAITLVGIRTIKNFALWSAVFSLMPNPKCGPFELKQLWQDSLRRALFARRMANLLGIKDAEASFAAALLQDLAVPLLAKELGTNYEELIEQRSEKRRLSDLEQERFGWTHADAGRVIARRWNLPEEFADLISHHTLLHSLLEDPAADPEQLAVALSAHLPAACDGNWHECNTFETAYNRLLRNQGPDIQEILGQLDEQFGEFAPVLDIQVPAKSLVDSYHEAAAPAP